MRLPFLTALAVVVSLTTALSANLLPPMNHILGRSVETNLVISVPAAILRNATDYTSITTRSSRSSEKPPDKREEGPDMVLMRHHDQEPSLGTADSSGTRPTVAGKTTGGPSSPEEKSNNAGVRGSNELRMGGTGALVTFLVAALFLV